MSVVPGKSEASAVIWTRDAVSPSQTALAARKRATLQGAVAGVGGALLFFWLDHSTMGVVAWSIGGTSMLAGWLSPLGLFAAIERAVLAVGRLVGAVMTWLLLAPVYLLVMTPFGWLTRRGARDTLRRSIDAEASTYWNKREPEEQQASLERPY